MYSNPSKFSLGVVLVLLLAFVSSWKIKAESITYTFYGVGSGTFGGQAFTNAPFTISLYADTANVVQWTNQYGNVLFSVSGSTSAVGVGTLGMGLFTTGKRVFNNQGLQALGFSLSDSNGSGNDLLDIQASVFATYDLKSSLGRLDHLTPQPGTLGINEPTTFGTISFTSKADISFQASIGEHAPPQLLAQPTNQTLHAGNSSTIVITATGAEPMEYRWIHNARSLSGSVSTLEISDVQSLDAGDYFVVVTNAFGAVTSQVATITVIPTGPTITLQPLSQVTPIGSTIEFNVAAKGSSPMAWQWYFNGLLLANGTSAELSITNVQDVSFGSYQAAVINQYGSSTTAVATLYHSPVITWGNPYFGITNVPLRATNVIEIAGGDDHCMVLGADGTVTAWGANDSGQANVPPGLTNVSAISAGSTHSLALRTDGTVVSWGAILGNPVSAVPPEVTNVTGLALGPGARHALALRADSTVVDWGSPFYGLTNVPPSASNIVAVAAGRDHCLALRADGTLVTWGDNRYGQCNVPKNATNLVAIASGWYHTLALRDDGTLVAWQATINIDGQTNIPPAATNIVSIACGANHCLAVRADGALFAWGRIGGDAGVTNTPPWATNIVAAAGTSWGTLALKAAGHPRITTKPVSRVALAGEHVRLLGSAVGAWPLSYQWLRDGIGLPDATQLRFSIPNIQPTSAGDYSLIASNSLGMVTGRITSVKVLSSPPRILALITNVAAISNNFTVLAVSATGSDPLAYQWIFGGTNLIDSTHVQGANSPVVTIAGVQPSDLGAYFVVITNGFGAVTSSVLTLRFATAAESVAQAVECPDRNWTLTGPLSWFWQTNVTHDGLDAAESGHIGDGMNTVMQTTNKGPCAVFFWWKVSSQTNLDFLRFYLNGGERLRISGEVDWQRRSYMAPVGAQYTFGWGYTKSGSVSVGQDRAWVDEVSFGPLEAPLLVNGPVGGVVTAGSNYTFAVSATGTEPFSYQWRLKETNLLGKTLETLTIPNVQFTSAGDYTVVVSNYGGAITSHVATLVVLPPGVSTHPWLLRTSRTELQILWSTGTLEAADSVEGPWSDVSGAISPLTVPIDSGSRFFRVRLGNL